MKFSIFDLDHTLLPIDTGDRWSRWLVRCAGLDRDAFEAKISAYAKAYQIGRFDPLEFVEFQFSLLAAQKRADLEAWRDAFVDEVVRPAICPEAVALVQSRRNAGFEVILATGTHRFVTAPVAELFGIRHLVAAAPEVGPDGEFTGRAAGSHSYGEGKLILVRELAALLLEEAGETPADIEAVEAWSDSVNDLPMLEWAAGHKPRGRAVAVNPDPKLEKEALARSWPILSLFAKEHAHD